MNRMSDCVSFLACCIDANDACLFQSVFFFFVDKEGWCFGADTKIALIPELIFCHVS